MKTFAELRLAHGVATSAIKPILIVPVESRHKRVLPVLTPLDEAALVERYISGDRRAGERLLSAHHKMLASKAARFSRNCSFLEECDLIQVGSIAFLESLKTFTGEGPLAAYAGTAAFHAMLGAVDEEDDTIKIGSYQKQAIRRALKSGGLSDKLAAINGLRKLESIDAPIDDDDDDRTLLDCLSMKGTPEDALIALEEYREAEHRHAELHPDTTERERDNGYDERFELVRSVSRGRIHCA